MTSLLTEQASSSKLYRPKLSRADMGFYGLMLLIIVLTFAIQAPNIGFYGANHGWTSSHGLAIMSHATPENYFVGYALQFRGADDAFSYNYFDRYPFFFSAGMNALLSLTDSLPLQVQIARAVMNVIYLGTVALAGWVVYEFVKNRWLAMTVTLLAFSGWWLVFYKDMVHYDQPALLGNFLLLYALIRYQREEKRRFFYVAALIAVSLGRGYASFMILGLWMLVDISRILLRSNDKRLLGLFRSDAIRVFILAITWGTALLGYNLMIESHQRNIPIQQTSIVDSALRRLPVGGEKDGGRTVGKDVPDWGAFTVLELDRLARWTLPVKLETVNVWGYVFSGVMILVALAYGVRQPLALLVAFWGVAWLAFMINLAHGHEYTMMYLVGLPLMFYTAILSPLRRSRWLVGGALVISIGVFTWAQWQVRVELSDPATNRAIYTEDYNRIAARITGEGRSVYVNISDGECVIENNFCYVPGFYLKDHYLSEFEPADYVLSRLPYYHAEPVFLPPDDENGLLLIADSLTPENTTAYLFDKAQAVRRNIPDDAGTLFRFGDALTLQNWSLQDDVTVQPCQRVHLESWWLTESELSANYSLLISMVDSNGADIAESNADLTFLPTRVWLPDMFHLDARYVTVPCDVPAGEYALVMSVYEPGAPASLDVFGSDGAALGDFVYLTTLFVGER